jgi:heavy metal sensor kinase
MEDLARVIDVFQRVFTVVMAALFILAAVIGWFMARRALSGVERVTRTAQRISGGSLTERVPVRGREDEIDQLAVTFNRMLDHIQSLMAGIKEMTDNIAHDLKSPITRIRGQAELALTGGGRQAEYEAMAGSAVEECDRLLDMIDTMLFISRTEAGVTRPQHQEMNLAAVVGDACRLFEALAEEKRIRLSCDTPQTLPLSGDTRLIQRMLANLLDNAIKYTPSGGAVSVSARRSPQDRATIDVKDTGPGISAADLPHIFERFYRGDPSRTQAGAGLGLSFARAVAHVHGGSITVESSPAGSAFSVEIPAAPP